MTICIGTMATDGIVLAADAEQGDSYIKSSQQKIMTWQNMSLGHGDPLLNPVGCVLAGSGDSGFIDAFTSFLLFAPGIEKIATLQELETLIGSRLEEFYGKHVLPFATVDSRYDFQMIIGAYFRFQTALFVTYKSTIRRGLPFVAIGIGASFASRLLDQAPISDVRRTEVIAANIVAATKDCIEGCGKYTDVVSIHNSSTVEGTNPGEGARLEHPHTMIARVSPSKIARWEHSFASRWADRQQKLTLELVDDELRSDDDMDRQKKLPRGKSKKR